LSGAHFCFDTILSYERGGLNLLDFLSEQRPGFIAEKALNYHTPRISEKSCPI